MLDKNGLICEYDGYELPPAPKVVTPEMRKRKEELIKEAYRHAQEAKARIEAEAAAKGKNV